MELRKIVCYNEWRHLKLLHQYFLVFHKTVLMYHCIPMPKRLLPLLFSWFSLSLKISQLHCASSSWFDWMSNYDCNNVAYSVLSFAIGLLVVSMEADFLRCLCIIFLNNNVAISFASLDFAAPWMGYESP